MAVNARVFTRLLRGRVTGDAAREIAMADDWIDEATSVMMYGDEPGLLSWLESDPDVARVMKANLSAVYQAIANDSMRNRSLDDSIRRVNKILFRTMSALAWRAAMRERAAVDEVVA